MEHSYFTRRPEGEQTFTVRPFVRNAFTVLLDPPPAAAVDLKIL